MLGKLYNHCGTARKKTSQIYFVGGRDTAVSYMDTGTQIYDTATATFSSTSGQMSEGRANFACTVLEEENLLIAAGGQAQGWAYTDSVEILDLTMETWTNVMATPSIGNVWAVGQVMFAWKNRDLHQYEPRSNQWLEIKDVPIHLPFLKPGFQNIPSSMANFCPFL